MRQEHRAASVAFITGTFSICLIVGPTIGGYLDSTMAVYSCLGLTGVALVYVVLLLPESAPRFRSTSPAKDPEVVSRKVSKNESEGVIPHERGGGKVGDETEETEERMGLSQEGALSEGACVDQVSNSGKATEGSSGPTPEDVALLISDGVKALPPIKAPPEAVRTKEPTDVGHDPPDAAAAAHAGSSGPNPPLRPPSWSLSRGWEVLLGSPWYLKLALIWALVGAASNGSQVRASPGQLLIVMIGLSSGY